MSGGLWLQVDVDFSDDPRVIDAAAELGVDPDYLAGKMLRVWGFTLKHAPSGVIESRSPAEIVEMAARWPTERRGELVAALHAVGLIHVAKTRAEMRGWVERYGRLVVVREKAKTKKRRQRLKKSSERPQGRPPMRPGDVPQMSPGESRGEETYRDPADGRTESRSGPAPEPSVRPSVRPPMAPSAEIEGLWAALSAAGGAKAGRRPPDLAELWALVKGSPTIPRAVAAYVRALKQTGEGSLRNKSVDNFLRTAAWRIEAEPEFMPEPDPEPLPACELCDEIASGFGPGYWVRFDSYGHRLCKRCFDAKPASVETVDAMSVWVASRRRELSTPILPALEVVR